jgi:hypothetical protein
MSRMKMLRNALFSAVTLSALTFGATQALAAPQQAKGVRACSGTQEAYCMDYCWKRGADGGYCLTGGGCKCIYN